MSDVVTRNFTGQFVRIQGRNVGLNTTLENLNEISLALLYAGSAFGSTAATLDVISSSTSDTNTAGTGARKVIIAGLDGNFNYQTEEVALNGQTAVTTTKTFLRVFSAECTLTGIGLVNAGDIYIYKTGTGGTITSGVPGTLTSAWIKLLAGYGHGTSGMYTTPAGKSARLTRVMISGRTQACEVQLYSQRLDDVTDTSLHMECAYEIGTAGITSIHYPDKTGPVFPPKTDIILRGLSSAAAGCAAAELVLEWVIPRS